MRLIEHLDSRERSQLTVAQMGETRHNRFERQTVVSVGLRPREDLGGKMSSHKMLELLHVPH